MNTPPAPATSSKSSSQKAGALGPWALVTGASDGIGRATALALAQMGLDLVLVARREAPLLALQQELKALGQKAVVVVADLATPEGIHATLTATAPVELGTVVLAAGFGTSGPFTTSPLDNELAMLDVNCRATVWLAHQFGTQMQKRGRGALVLYSSLLAFQGVPGSAHYAATKAYVQTFAEGLGRELAPHGVDVLSVAPGPVHTGFATRAGMTMGQASTPEVVAKATVRRLLRGGGRTLRPGFLAKLLESMLALLPRPGRVRVLEKIMAGMSNAR